MPPRLGAWLLSCCASLALTGFSVAASPAFPVKRGADPRYLVDQNDRPFLFNGDGPWSLIAQPTREEAEDYLRNRRLKGFNSLIVNLIEHEHCDNPPYNRYGAAPFTVADYTKEPGKVYFRSVDYTTPNEAYFAHADWVIRKAAEYGMQVLLNPSYLGWGGNTKEGWNAEMLANGTTKLREYGRYLGNRYKDFDNIIWLNGGDYNPVGPEKENVNAIAEGIREFDTRHLHTAHTGEEFSALDTYPTESWLGVNNTYSYKNVLGMSRADYLRNPVQPFFMFESNYEGDWHNVSNQVIRRAAYWSVLSGASGHLMGNFPLYAFRDDAVKGTWRAAMDGEASRDMANFRRLMDSRDWWKYVPDMNNTIVVAGQGTPVDPLLNPSTPLPSADYYVTAARIPDGSSLWAYVPNSRTITVDMTKISGTSAKAWWFSPRTGVATLIGEFGNSGQQAFTTPATEGASQDWVLVMDDAALNPPPPGMTRFAEWRKHFFSPSELADPEISGENADPDRDGNNNLMEYALLGDPTASDAALMRKVVNFPAAGSGNVLTVDYARRKNAADITMRMMASSDARTWGPLTENVTKDHGLSVSVNAQDNTPASAQPQRFVRLEIQLAPQ